MGPILAHCWQRAQKLEKLKLKDVDGEQNGQMAQKNRCILIGLLSTTHQFTSIIKSISTLKHSETIPETITEVGHSPFSMVFHFHGCFGGGSVPSTLRPGKLLGRAPSLSSSVCAGT